MYYIGNSNPIFDPYVYWPEPLKITDIIEGKIDMEIYRDKGIRINADMSPEQKEKELENLQYTLTHIDNIRTAWNIMKSTGSCVNIIRSYTTVDIAAFLEYMDRKIYIHDQSKFSKEEWEPYRKNFCPINDEEKEANKSDFEAAWKHHYTVNHHHWQYWYKVKKDVNAMPLDDIIEQCCDWIAMSMVFPGTAYDFFKNRVIDKNCKEDEKIYLSDFATEVTEKILKAYYEANPKIE